MQMAGTKRTISFMGPTRADFRREPLEKALSYKTSQKDVVRFLSQVMEKYSSKVTWLELKLCMSRTMPRRQGSLNSLKTVTVTCIRRSLHRPFHVTWTVEV